MHCLCQACSVYALTKLLSPSHIHFRHQEQSLGFMKIKPMFFQIIVPESEQMLTLT